MQKRKLCAGVLLLALLAACGPGDSVPSAPPTPAFETPRMTRADFPILNGSTSTVPLARAVCSVLLGETVDEVGDLVHFSKTSASYRSLMDGWADLLLAAEPSDTVLEEKAEADYHWEMAPIATDALVFLVNEGNPVDSLTTEQVQGIYTGEITNWKQVGGEDRAIEPFQRNAEAGSQTLMKKLVMGDLELMEPAKDYVVSSMEGLIEAVRSFDGTPGAIGYTVYYYANDMNMADGLKVVTIDGAAPDASGIRSGSYPFTNPYYAVISEAELEHSATRQVFEWLQGPAGQSLISHEGYVSILADPPKIDWDLGETEPMVEVYTRRYPDFTDHLIPADDYGLLLPYVGETVWGEWADFDRYGLITMDGEIVVDPVYDAVWQMTYYQGKSRPIHRYTLARTVPNGENGGQEQRYAVAALDGSWVTDFSYRSVAAVDAEHIWAVLENGDGVMMDADCQELWRLPLPEGAELWRYQTGSGGGLEWFNGVGVMWGGEQTFLTMEGTQISAGSRTWTDMQYFSEGLAQARDGSSENERWGYIDQSGEWAVSPVYAFCGEFNRGKAIVQMPDGTQAVIDRTGNVLWNEPEGKLIYMTGVDFSYYVHWEPPEDEDRQYEMKILAFYDETLTKIPTEAVGKILQWGDGGWLYEWSSDGMDLYSVLGKRHLPTGGMFSFLPDEGMVFRDDSGETVLWSVYTLDGTELLPPTACHYVGWTTDLVTGEPYFFAEYPGRYDVYRVTGDFVLTTPAYYVQVQNGLFTCRTELSYGYKNRDGEWVFRILLTKSQGD